MSYSSRQFAKQWINHYSRKDINHHVKGSDSAANRRTLVVVPFSAVIDDRLGDGRLDTFTTTADTEMDLNTAANWDTVTPTDYTVAATRAGKDFYIYACIQAGSTPKLLLSAASTYPSGYTATNSRKIGGFHTLAAATASLPAGHNYLDFEVGSILYHSIWDLKQRPIASPEGMTRDDRTGLWWDIYLNSSADGLTPTSVFGGTIADTVTWLDAVDFGALQKKRLARDGEFQSAARNSNEKTNIAGTADPATVTAAVDTAGRSMISDIGCWGMAGIENQWLDEQTFQFNSDGRVDACNKITTVYHVASPGGNPIYLKFGAGRPYLCCNMATDTVDKTLAFTSPYTVVVMHDANAATGGLAVYIDDDATHPGRLLVNNTQLAQNCFIPTSNPAFFLQITHNASAATAGVALYYDDGSDERLEATMPSAANAYLDLAAMGLQWATNTLSGDKGGYVGQGSRVKYGDVKFTAGGSWAQGVACGSRSRYVYYSRDATAATVCARYVSDPLSSVS